MSDTKVEYVFDQHSSQPPQVISMTQERYEAAIAEARAAEREQCCKDVCADCARGRPVEIGGQGKNYFDSKVYYHWVDNDLLFWICNANAIRQRAAKGL
jgi:hypothetical protein